MRWRRDEGGVVIIFFALMLVACVIMIALVIDLGILRADRKSNKSTADHATAAGLLALEDTSAGDGRPHPWRGVCEAYNYVKANGSELASFTNERWTDQSDLTVNLADGPVHPCDDPTRLGSVCTPGLLETYARFAGHADGGRVQVEIRSGYRMPDPAFAEDAVRVGDNGDPAEQGCDHLSVVIRESQPRGFSAIIGNDELSTRVRTVGRVTLGSGLDAPASLLLLERRECRALRVESVDSRVVVEHSDDDGPGPGTDGVWPGLIHSDSDGSLCATDGSEAVLEGRVGSAGPTILARSATQAHPDTGTILPGQITVYAKFFAGRPAHTPFPTTIGDTEPRAAQRQGRRRVDEKYLAGVTQLANQAGPLVARDLPPDDQWTLFENNEGCRIAPGGPIASRVGTVPNKLWFKCPELWVKDAPLILATPDLEIVITGSLRVDQPFEVHDLRRLWMRGKSSGDRIAISASGALRLNTGNTTPCPVDAAGATLPGKTASLFVADGRFEVRSGGRFRACSTLMLLKGGQALPPMPGTTAHPTCASPTWASSTGTFLTTAGGLVEEWTAPNELAGVQPSPAYLLTHPFEDLALWTEAAAGSELLGGAGTIVKGVFFLPNAHDFKISGNGTGDMPASAQFIACRMRVGGAGTWRMTPDAYNFVLVPSFEGFDLVR